MSTASALRSVRSWRISASISASSSSRPLLLVSSLTSQYSIRMRPLMSSRPSMRLRYESRNGSSASSVMASSIGNSRRRVSERTTSGLISAVTPRIRPTLAILDPSALPTASSVAPFSAALMDTIISGAEVPKPTTVKPMSSADTPRRCAVAAAPMTKRSAPHTSSAKPASTAVI